MSMVLNCSTIRSCMIKLFSAVSLSVIQWFNFICIFSVDYQNIIVLEMTGNYSIHFLPKKSPLPLIVQHSSRWIPQRYMTKFHTLQRSKITSKKGFLAMKQPKLLLMIVYRREKHWTECPIGSGIKRKKGNPKSVTWKTIN